MLQSRAVLPHAASVRFVPAPCPLCAFCVPALLAVGILFALRLACLQAVNCMPCLPSRIASWRLTAGGMSLSACGCVPVSSGRCRRFASRSCRRAACLLAVLGVCGVQGVCLLLHYAMCGNDMQGKCVSVRRRRKCYNDDV